jgi:hypothetical protein
MPNSSPSKPTAMDGDEFGGFDKERIEALTRLA